MEQIAKYAVLGDIGGTNFRLRLLNLADKTTLLQKTYSATEHPKLKSYIDEILQEGNLDFSCLRHIVLAIRGAVI